MEIILIFNMKQIKFKIYLFIYSFIMIVLQLINSKRSINSRPGMSILVFPKEITEFYVKDKSAKEPYT